MLQNGKDKFCIVEGQHSSFSRVSKLWFLSSICHAEAMYLSQEDNAIQNGKESGRENRGED